MLQRSSHREAPSSHVRCWKKMKQDGQMGLKDTPGARAARRGLVQYMAKEDGHEAWRQRRLEDSLTVTQKASVRGDDCKGRRTRRGGWILSAVKDDT